VLDLSLLLSIKAFQCLAELLLELSSFLFVSRFELIDFRGVNLTIFLEIETLSYQCELLLLKFGLPKLRFEICFLTALEMSGSIPNPACSRK